MSHTTPFYGCHLLTAPITLVHDIDEDDFNVEKGGQVEIIGWLYQYYNTEPKAQVFGRPSGTKIRKEDIPAATQLFTLDWMVLSMVENFIKPPPVLPPEPW